MAPDYCMVIQAITSLYAEFSKFEWLQSVDYPTLDSPVNNILGVKRYALVTIRYLPRYIVHNMICSTIHFFVLGWKAEAYNPGLWSRAPHSTCFCLRSNHVQWVQQRRPRRSFQVQCFCVEFPHFIGIYWLSVRICSFLTIARDRTVSYRIFISLSVSRYVSSAQIYRCIGTTMNRFTPTT